MTITDIKRHIPNGANGTGMKGYAFIGLADEYGRAEDVETVTDNEITAFNTTIEFSVFEVARDSFKWKAANVGEYDSKSYDVEGEFFIAGITKERSKLLGELANYPLVMIAEDRRSNLRKMGEQYDGVSIMVDEETENRNGYLIKYEIKGLAFSPRFVSSHSIVPVPTPPASGGN